MNSIKKRHDDEFYDQSHKNEHKGGRFYGN